MKIALDLILNCTTFSLTFDSLSLYFSLGGGVNMSGKNTKIL